MSSNVSLEYLNSRISGLTVTSPTSMALSAQNTSGSSISVILLGTAIPLANKPYQNGFSSNGANTVFTCTNAGKYYISYKVNTTASLLLDCGVYINGSNNSNLACEPGILATNYNGQAIVNLNAGDSVQLTMYGLLGTAVLQSGAGASMNIIRIA